MAAPEQPPQAQVREHARHGSFTHAQSHETALVELAGVVPRSTLRMSQSMQHSRVQGGNLRAAHAWHGHMPGKRVFRADEHPSRAHCAQQAAAWDGQGAAGGRVDVMRAGSDDSPSKRNSALDLTGAAIIKSTPGEGAQEHPLTACAKDRARTSLHSRLIGPGLADRSATQRRVLFRTAPWLA